MDYWRVIRKHIWLIIGIAVLIPTLVAIYLVRKPEGSKFVYLPFKGKDFEARYEQK